MEKNILITNIQRFSLYDGSGIRTTIFLKGCMLCCPWCCNPENINMKPEKYEKDNQIGCYGNYLSWEQIYKEILKDKIYYDNDGGVTYSGGEPLLQANNLLPLWKKLKENRIGQCIETSLMCTKDKLELALEYIDVFYVDVKILIPQQANRIGLNLDIYYNNIDLLFKNEKSVIFRIPFIAGYTDMEENRTEIKKFIASHKPRSVEILNGHNLGSSKYKTLGLDYDNIKVLENKECLEYMKEIQELGITANVLRI